MKKRVCVFAVLLCFASALFAQFDSGSVLGNIRDNSGAVVPGATVTLTNLDTGITSRTTTAGSGEYEFASVRVGRYRVAAEKSGFAAAIANDVVVNVSARQRVD